MGEGDCHLVVDDGAKTKKRRHVSLEVPLQLKYIWFCDPVLALSRSLSSLFPASEFSSVKEMEPLRLLWGGLRVHMR